MYSKHALLIARFMVKLELRLLLATVTYDYLQREKYCIAKNFRGINFCFLCTVVPLREKIFSNAVKVAMLCNLNTGETKQSQKTFHQWEQVPKIVKISSYTVKVTIMCLDSDSCKNVYILFRAIIRSLQWISFPII